MLDLDQKIYTYIHVPRFIEIETIIKRSNKQAERILVIQSLMVNYTCNNLSQGSTPEYGQYGNYRSKSHISVNMLRPR